VTGPDAAVEAVVHGAVQGVFFRDTCRSEAREAGVRGWVRNEPDGTVRAHFEGSHEAVDRLTAWAHHGPPRARVDHVDVAPTEPDGSQGFEVR
jgi:acylphosphatase